MDEGTLILVGTIALAIAFTVMSVWPLADEWFDDNENQEKW